MTCGDNLGSGVLRDKAFVEPDVRIWDVVHGDKGGSGDLPEDEESQKLDLLGVPGCRETRGSGLSSSPPASLSAGGVG